MINKELSKTKVEWIKYKANAVTLREQHLGPCVDKSICDKRRAQRIKDLQQREKARRKFK